MEQFLLRKNGLLIGVKIDAKSEIGKDDPPTFQMSGSSPRSP
jgi:hypothetical protein